MTTKPKAKPATRGSSRNAVESSQQKRVTSERISADLEAFEEAGGHVEVLGTTRVLTKVDEPAAN